MPSADSDVGLTPLYRRISTWALNLATRIFLGILRMLRLPRPQPFIAPRLLPIFPVSIRSRSWRRAAGRARQERPRSERHDRPGELAASEAPLTQQPGSEQWRSRGIQISVRDAPAFRRPAIAHPRPPSSVCIVDAGREHAASKTKSPSQ